MVHHKIIFTRRLIRVYLVCDSKVRQDQSKMRIEASTSQSETCPLISVRQPSARGR